MVDDANAYPPYKTRLSPFASNLKAANSGLFYSYTQKFKFSACVYFYGNDNHNRSGFTFLYVF
jgi:hypothetical protein